MFLEILIEIT